MTTLTQISEQLKAAAIGEGFDLVGIAPVSEAALPEADEFEQWIAAGHAGDMKYLEKRDEHGNLRRASVRNSAAWAKSVVVCALNYNTDQPYSTRVAGSDPERGWLSRYAWGAHDYHDALMPRLRRVEAAIHELCADVAIEPETRCYVDTGPILERAYAKYAGVGWIGKNTCIIHPKMGSWLFLGVIVTSLELMLDAPMPDRCGSCTRCIDACPTDAILAPGNLDARRCIAYLTIEKRGSLDEELRPEMGEHIFGCDICQDVCPWNTKSGNAPATSLAEFQAREGLFRPDLQRLAEMDEEAFRQTFRHSPVKRAKFSGMKRNVAVAMGNSGNKAFLPVLERMAAGDDEMVAEHARWAMERLRELQ
jgi:epoxyqueuosine reductase